MSKRYFINNIDTYVGQGLLRELVKKEAEGEEPQDPSEYNIMGTYTDHYRTDKPKGVKKILKRYKPKLSRKLMLEKNDVWIYDLHDGDPKDIKFAVDCLNSMPALEEQKVLILVSNVMVWGNTQKIEKKETVVVEQGQEQEAAAGDEEEEQQNLNSGGSSKKNLEDEEEQEQQQVVQVEDAPKDVEYIPFTEDDYELRVPLDSYTYMKEYEDMVLSLNKENLKVLVVCSGILYGQGEIVFKNHLKAGWIQQPANLPVLGHGNNKIPCIHINDLCKFIVKFAENPQDKPSSYCLALDNSQHSTQNDLVQAIANGVGTGKITNYLEEDNEEFNNILVHKQHLSLDLNMRTSKLLISGDPEADTFEWHALTGLHGNIHKVLQEFEQSENLRPLKLVAYFEQSDEQLLRINEITQCLSRFYRIPIINVENCVNECLKQDTELAKDLQEEFEQVQELLKNKQFFQLSEPAKVLFRVIKWRLSQNDCRNRGFVLLNYPFSSQQAETIFIDQKKKLNRKKKPVEKVKQETDDPEAEQPQEEVQEEEQAEEEEEGGPKQELFYPESLIIFKSFEKNQSLHLEAMDFFESRGTDILSYDPKHRQIEEVEESLRLYIERNARPYNYLPSQSEMKQAHDEYYYQLNARLEQFKQETAEQNKKKLDQERTLKVNLAKEQWKYIQEHELNDPEQLKPGSFRQYLMKNIVPFLSEGLLEVTSTKPKDPVDFLAEFLYKRSFDI